MIQKMEYVSGNIQVKDSGYRYVLESEKVVEGVTIPESDYSHADQLAKNVFGAIKEIGAVEGKAVFDSKTADIKWNGLLITPESNLDDLPDGVAAFATAIYEFNDGEYRKKWEAIREAAAQRRNISAAKAVKEKSKLDRLVKLLIDKEVITNKEIDPKV